MAKISLDFTESAKSTKVSLSNESKKTDLTWAEADWTWDSADSPWSHPRYTLSKTTKSKITLDTSGTTK